MEKETSATQRQAEIFTDSALWDLCPQTAYIVPAGAPGSPGQRVMTAPEELHEALIERSHELTRALGDWARDDREAANVAMSTIDAMLAELHSARSALVSETRASDDATAARVDAMLAARKAASCKPQVDSAAVNRGFTAGSRDGAA